MRNFTHSFEENDSALAAVPSELLIPELKTVLLDRGDEEDLGLRRLLEYPDPLVRPRKRSRKVRTELEPDWDDAA